VRDDEVDLERDELGRKSVEPGVLPFRSPRLDHEILAFRISEIAQPLSERVQK
jgi:hypothetical protein